jgi:hypothetical protein
MPKHKAQPSATLQTLISHAVSSGRSEGHPVPMVAVARSEGSVMFGLDMGSAPVPTRRYAADACSIDIKSGDVRFIFAQRSLNDEEFESALVVRLNPLAARQFIDSLKGIQEPTIAQVASNVGESIRALEPITKARQMVSVLANLASVAIAGFESCVDFYHASAFAMRAIDVKGKNQLELEPVVRVELRTGLFLAVLEALEEIADQLPDREKSDGDTYGTA